MQPVYTHNSLPGRRGDFLTWRIIQFLFWLVGIVLLIILFYKPGLGTLLFWNVLIPLAPALLVLCTGIWRNICPLGTTSLLPDRLGISRGLKIPARVQPVLHLTGLILLLVIIPLRHVLFNHDGIATGLLIMGLATLAFAGGILFERKSAWCSGLCPVHPVEKLYGSGVAFTLTNAHCADCVKCSVPCPDSSPVTKPFLLHRSAVTKATEFLLAGAFPGYIWGWFHTPEYTGAEGWKHLDIIYGLPLAGSACSFVFYLLLTRLFPNQQNRVIRLFAAAAVSCYYWYRLPLLFGFNQDEPHHLLIDLSPVLPYWSITVFTVLTTAFFTWWILIRKRERSSWSFRPGPAKKKEASR